MLQRLATSVTDALTCVNADALISNRGIGGGEPEGHEGTDGELWCVRAITCIFIDHHQASLMTTTRSPAFSQSGPSAADHAQARHPWLVPGLRGAAPLLGAGGSDGSGLSASAVHD
ncbi:hypothetical protein ACIQM0_15005 [Streptomyces sp. NPDC091387]|uniref:hypothetical protein n=1 Tax=Streptomyces sp. NPDC091387 TaxID=3365998 RepID=UPI00382B78C9